MSVVERIPSAISYQIELDRQARIRYEKEKQEEKEAKRLSDNSVRTNANRLTKELIRLINAGSHNLRVVLPFRGSPECRRIAEILAKRFKKKGYGWPRYDIDPCYPDHLGIDGENVTPESNPNKEPTFSL